ncbi:CRISPR-associated Csd1 family protein [Deinococcus seoulensis]|uniref:CRISPR-associated Csd1 family protein n=1 Tax=Deinococcus seoulensis TaxID=1837379 RepID=A0ABQ2RTG5_9DEIO|nr:type I-C CRISPR-associated protein Cas8c/Csd1 [Deinococcus seoulensis]GGR62940.1 CRISPR-associated Csd1 family protein [Deinococcus seoulensis]
MYTYLLEFVRRSGQPTVPYGYEPAPPGIVIEVMADRIVSISAASKTVRPVLVPKLPAARTNKIVSQLATDTLEYTLGVPRDAKSPQRHTEYLKRLKAAADATGHAGLLSLHAAITADGPALLAGTHDLTLPTDLAPQALTVVYVNGNHLHDDPAVQAYWQTLILAGGRPGEDGVRPDPGLYTDRLPATASARVRGKEGKQEKAMLASADKFAFHNYGLVNSFGTGLTAQTADELGKAINALLKDPKHTVNLNTADLIYWTTTPDDLPLDWLFDPQPEDIQNLLQAPQSGQEPLTVQDGDFHGLLLGSNKSRLVVLGQFQGTLMDTQAHIHAFLRRLRVPDRRYHAATLRPFGIRSVLRDLNGNDGPKGAALPPGLDEALLRHALTGTPLPRSLATVITTRARTPAHVTPALAALGNLTLTSAGILQEDHAMHDPPTNADLAYRVGQLLALASNIQRQAMGTVNTSLADTYFGLASRNPSQAVGLILTNATVHLKKIRRATPGLAAHFDGQIKELTAPFQAGTLPTTLTPEEQTAFTLGYYHQLHTPGDRA